MASFRDLVDVKFQDATSHVMTTGQDTMGVILPYFWGPADQLKVYDEASFYEAYPESLPLATSFDNANHVFDAYAQIKKFFDNGGARVEVFRPSLSDKYHGVGDADSNANYYVTFKYPGLIPASLLPQDTKSLKITVTLTKVTLWYTTEAHEASSDSWKVLEEWDGQFADVNKQENGVFTHFQYVLNRSQLLKCAPVSDYTNPVIVKSDVIIEGDAASPISWIAPDITNSDVAVNLKKVIEDTFGDIERTKSSIIISPVACTTDHYDETLKGLAANNMIYNYVSGCKTTSLAHAPGGLISGPDRFQYLIYGLEYVYLFGNNRVLLNCVGGFVGATFKIAKDIRLNQAASAKTYGAYVGTLAETLTFAEVQNFHEAGIGCVYTTSNGPQIFGIHNTLYSTSPNSYFALWNVMRVTAAILTDIFPLVIAAIHTDTAANPITRSVFETQIDSIVKSYAANQNLQADSAGICNDVLNTDYLTKGGKILNIVLSLHYIGLTERVNIKIVATDSSVTAEFI